MRTTIQKTSQFDRQAKAIFFAFVRYVRQPFLLDLHSRQYLETGRKLIKRCEKFLTFNRKRKEIIGWLWNSAIEKMLKSKTTKPELKKQLNEIPESIKNAVIHKWMRYMKHIYVCKVMLFRKSMMKTGFRNYDCLMCYKFGRETIKNIKMKYLDKLFKEITPGNFETQIASFVDSSQKGEYIKSIPPLLDPVLCKDIKNFDKVVESHLNWCKLLWKPTADISQCDVNGNALPIPADEEQARHHYRYLGRDDPQIMEFIPHESVIKKLIERAMQLNEDNVDILLNPYDKHVQSNTSN